MADTPREVDTSPTPTFPPRPGSGELEIVESPWPGADTPSPGGVLDFGVLGAFRLEACLGRGGMGEVYRARQTGAKGFSQTVAIKRLRSGRRDWEVRAFADEARVLSMLHHENIARVYGFFELRGSFYLVMEYVHGQTLHSLLEMSRRKEQRLSVRSACEIAAAVADALHCAHGVHDEEGRPLHLVHRDVSPTNILVSRTGRTKLVDFGVAYFRLEGRTETSSTSTVIKGKAPYLSPEQVKHRPVDARSDLFSLGTILVEMLTGAAPFGWTADHMTLRRIAQVTPEYVALATSGMSWKLRAICQKLLAAEPGQRFASGKEAALALRKLASGPDGPACVQADVERLKALPDGPGPYLRDVPWAPREIRRMRAALAWVRGIALAGLALVLAILLAISLISPDPRDAPTPPPPPRSPPPPPPSAGQATSACTSGPAGQKALALAHLVTFAAACQPHASPDAMPAECARERVNQVRNESGRWVDLPRQFRVDFVSLEGEKCTGAPLDWGRVGPGLERLGPLDEGKREPCPFGDGRILATMSWRDPRTDGFRPDPEPRFRERPLLLGRARVVPSGTVDLLDEPTRVERPRAADARMTALFTEMRRVDGVEVSICGVLFWRDGKEGIPVLIDEYYGRRVAADWGEGSFVQLYNP